MFYPSSDSVSGSSVIGGRAWREGGQSRDLCTNGKMEN